MDPGQLRELSLTELMDRIGQGLYRKADTPTRAEARDSLIELRARIDTIETMVARWRAAHPGDNGNG